MNQRYKVQIPWENILDLEKGYFPDGWLIREALMKDDHFDQAVERLSTTKIIAPIFYIIGGVDGSMDGAIITRNQTAINGPVHDGEEFNEPLYLKDSPHDWFLIETNFDYWKFPKDTRRDHAILHLNRIGQKDISFDTLFEVLSTPPVLADHTIFTSLYRPSEPDNFNITIRYDTAG